MATATATRKDRYSRSEERAAAVLLRMSTQERKALAAVAARRGTTATELLREQLLKVIEEA